jgi:LmbE family N-acetylglucosaminyl deacetylase
MEGWPQNSAPGSFWSASVTEATDRLSALMRQYRPDVVVTYDENGFYGHPDHIQAHRITMAAVEQTGIPAKVYWTTMPHSAMEKFGQIIRELEAESSSSEPAGEPSGTDDLNPSGDEAMTFGLPDDQISTWVDTRAFGQQKFDAMSAHASQNDTAAFLGMGVDRMNELMGVETFSRVKDSTDTPLPEDDLFAGLTT